MQRVGCDDKGPTFPFSAMCHCSERRRTWGFSQHDAGPGGPLRLPLPHRVSGTFRRLSTRIPGGGAGRPHAALCGFWRALSGKQTRTVKVTLLLSCDVTCASVSSLAFSSWATRSHWSVQLRGGAWNDGGCGV